jgi:hypothetical protein
MRGNGWAWGTAALGAVMFGVLALGEHGCGGGSATTTAVTHPPWNELPQPQLSVEGGTALSAGGQGQPGGTVHLLASGDISFDQSAAAPAAPTVPSTPADAMAVDANALGADVQAPGSAVISGDVTTSGGDATRTIAAGGDLYVTGTLRAADASGGRQAIDLQAGGTLYVSGTVDTSGASGGQAGGALHLSASRIVITGKLLTSGGQHESAAGAGGAITIEAKDAIAFAGTIEAFGGNASDAAAVTGGNAGALALSAGGDVSVSGTVLARGGAATTTAAGGAQGGAAATITIDAGGAVDIGGVVDARGGLATASGAGGPVAGGGAGGLRVGEKQAPSAILIRVPVLAMGGAGDSAGGLGGIVTPEPATGNIVVNGAHAIDVSGGDSLAAPGTGGQVNGGPRDANGGGLHIAGEIAANGGSITKGGAGNGADGGRIDIELVPTNGAVLLDQSAKVMADGGKSGGGGVAGGGGHVWMFTMDGDLTVAGVITARGGDGDGDGTGGLGGMIYLFSDNNHNGVDVGLGNLLIDTTGKLDASGGDGATGGSARSDGIAGSVAPFPEMQETFAIFLNCDGQHGETRNWMQNNGVLIARGGAHNGNGGDIVYHGIGPGQRDMATDGSGNHHPPSGNVDMSGDGTGLPGDYGGE